MADPHSTTPGFTPRMMAAFAALPLVDAVVAYVMYPVLWRMGPAPFQPDPAQFASGIAIFTGTVGFCVTIGGAVPAVLWLKMRGRLSAPTLALAGLALGNAPFVAYLLYILPFAVGHMAAGTMSEHLLPASAVVTLTLRAVTLGSIIGVVSGLTFWFVGVRGRDA